ncbi:hypothetical protein DPMN_134621 [Dreissena polymorpha]|uniref:Uncharacterized protein n=1 Tax=Dreissena polymorpha TaxID=45954 RepID=A0A9D4JFZ5_DREPO|nr:hypothetical protein DPMN_134621 [Dreissena polymorpha]
MKKGSLDFVTLVQETEKEIAARQSTVITDSLSWPSWDHPQANHDDNMMKTSFVVAWPDNTVQARDQYVYCLRDQASTGMNRGPTGMIRCSNGMNRGRPGTTGAPPGKY